MDSMCSGKTCIACAKAKIKCDKNLPSCSRCVRLGIDCHSQSRGRGRPKGVVAIKPQQSDEFCDKPTTIQVKQKELPRAAIQKKRNFPKNLMMLESIKSALQEEAQNGIKEEALMKACAVTNWLFHLACCTKSEDMYDSVSGIWEMLNVGDSLEFFEKRPVQTTFDRSKMHIPSYVSSLNCDGSAFLIQQTVNGSCLFSANEDMTEQFMSTKEANALYIEGGGDPDTVARSLINTKDRKTYLSAVTSLLVHNPNMNSETSLLVHCNLKNSQVDTILCLCQIRLTISVDGRDLCMGTKFTPLPGQSDYLKATAIVSPKYAAMKVATTASEKFFQKNSSVSSVPRCVTIASSDTTSEDEEEEPLTPYSADATLLDGVQVAGGGHDESNSNNTAIDPFEAHNVSASWIDVHPPELFDTSTFDVYEEFGLWDSQPNQQPIHHNTNHLMMDESGVTAMHSNSEGVEESYRSMHLNDDLVTMTAPPPAPPPAPSLTVAKQETLVGQHSFVKKYGHALWHVPPPPQQQQQSSSSLSAPALCSDDENDLKRKVSSTAYMSSISQPPRISRNHEQPHHHQLSYQVPETSHVYLSKELLPPLPSPAMRNLVEDGHPSSSSQCDSIMEDPYRLQQPAPPLAAAPFKTMTDARMDEYFMSGFPV